MVMKAQISVEELTASLNKQDFDTSCHITNNMNDVRIINPFEEHYVDENEEEEDDDDDLSEEALLEQMGYVVTDKSYKIDDHEKENEEGDDLSEDLILHQPNNTPTADLNLVSALKGSREKEGVQGQGCRVTWAPDVYDPVHTPPEEFVSNNIETKSERNSWGGKNKQKKGKGAGKEKKNKGDRQVEKKYGKKHGGSSSRRRSFDE